MVTKQEKESQNVSSRWLSTSIVGGKQLSGLCLHGCLTSHTCLCDVRVTDVEP